MFFVISCNIHRRLFLSFPHLVNHPVQEWSGSQWRAWSCFVVSNNDLLWPCFSWRDHNGLPRFITKFFLDHNALLRSIVLGLLMKETWLGLVCFSPKSYNGLPRSIIHRFVSFPLLRRPSFVNVPPWVAWWVRVFKADYNESHRSILFFSSRTPGALTFIAFLPRASWRRRWQSWRRHCNKAHQWPRLRCDSFFSWILLYSFCHLLSTAQTVELKRLTLNTHNKQMIPFITCEVSLGENVCELVFDVNVFDLDFLGSKLIRSNNQSSATLWVLATCLIVGLLPFMIILKTASLSSNTYNKASWSGTWTFEGTLSTLFKMSNISWDRLFGPWLLSQFTTGCTVLSWVCIVIPRTKTIRSRKSRAGIPSNLNPASKEMISDSVELCETEVCFIHIQLTGTNVWLPKTHYVPPDVDFESSRSPAISGSWNSPSLHCFAVLPT